MDIRKSLEIRSLACIVGQLSEHERYNIYSIFGENAIFSSEIPDQIKQLFSFAKESFVSGLFMVYTSWFLLSVYCTQSRV